METTKGIYILKVKEKKPAAVPPLGTGKEPGGAGRCGRARHKNWPSRRPSRRSAELAEGGPNLKLQETGRFGYSAKGDIPKIGTAPEIMDAAFNLTAAAPVAKTPFQVGDRWYAIKLKERTELNKESFAQEKEQIKQSLLPKKQQEALDAWLKDLKAKAKIEINPALLAD